MSTPASPLSVQDFAARIRSKYPGAYDSLPDQELATRVVAKYPEYKDKVALGAAPGSQAVSQGHGASSSWGDQAAPQSDINEGGWRSFVSQVAPIPGALADMFSGKATMPDPGQAAAMASNFMTAGGQYAKPRDPNSGQPITVPPDMRNLHLAAALLSPLGGQSLEKMLEQTEAGNFKGAAGTGAGIAAPLLATKGLEKLPTATEFFRPGMNEVSHRMLGDAASKVKQTVGQGGQVHQAISGHFQRLANDVIAADYASGKKIPMNDIWEQALEHADDYAAGKTTPKFNAIVQEIQNRPTELTWKELHDLQQNVDKVTQGASEGTRDAGAATKIRASIAKKLDDKAADVGRGEQWNAAKTIWRTLKEYQGDGVLGKLLSTGTEPVSPGGVTEGGKAFFDVLRDPANQAKLTEINKGFEPYGLPKDYFKGVIKTHAPLDDYLEAQKGTMSRVRLVLQHPKEAAVPGIIGTAIGSATGTPMGAFLGGSAGALTGVRTAARARAAGAIADLGGRPEITSPLTEASKVQPVGTGEKPTAPKPPEGAVSVDELTDALKSLGYKKADATNLARQAISEYPTDFNSALKRAMQGPSAGAKVNDIAKVKSVSGGSQASERGTYMRDPRTQQQILSGLQELKGSQKKGATIESRAEPMSPKSIASHNDAFAQAKQEWQAANPGKDPANHMSEIARRAETLRKGK